MFADSPDSLAVDFASDWRRRVQTKESAAQCAPITTQDAGLQSTLSESIEVQTEPEPDKPFVLLRNYNVERLEKFLSLAYPDMSAQLLKNIRSTVFEGYTVNWEEEVDAVSTRYVLNHNQREEKTVASNVSWNSMGSQLAIAYGRLDHENWCTHKGLLAVWNFSRREVDCNQANLALEVSSCLLCVEFHPKLPNLVVGGTFNGEIAVWDVYKEQNNLLVASKMSEHSHQEPVAKVSWLAGTKPGTHRILSFASDGKALIWELHSSSLTLLQGSQLLLNRVPRHLRGAVSLQGDLPMGGTCFSLFKENNSNFIVGLEGGHVFNCSLKNAIDVKSALPGKPFSNPVTFHFEPHAGPVYGISTSPFHRNLFLTCSTDGSIRLYDSLRTEVVKVMEPNCGYLYAVEWSRSRATVFAASTADGKILIYDLSEHESIPFVTLKAVTKPGTVVTALAFNAAKPELLASTDSLGETRVWRLSSHLIHGDASRDLRILHEYSNLKERGDTDSL